MAKEAPKHNNHGGGGTDEDGKERLPKTEGRRKRERERERERETETERCEQGRRTKEDENAKIGQ